ncbi:MAG: transcription termination/antitermination protein NusG [Alphaproteobacteria bacterium]|nr:MAG: transcription termination/antitermination protein NusG [Alphaproteobacteria bacterium]
MTATQDHTAEEAAVDGSPAREEGGEAATDAQAGEERRRVPGARWYIIHAYSGFEKKVADAIREQARIQGLEPLIEDVVVPTEEVVEVRKGEKRKAERKFFPGYVLIRMKLTDDTYHLVRNTPKVSGFLGPQGRPTPVRDAEADRILNQVKEGVERPKPKVQFEVGEEVRVKEGPFTSFTGMVEEVDEQRARLKVSVSIFGRATPVELEFHQVEKV